MSVFSQMMDQQQQSKKNNLAGQLSLFDLVGEEERRDYEIRLPDIGEYPKEVLLNFEKEVLGIYISGHPLEEYEQLWKKNITNTTGDFLLDEETNEAHVQDGARVTIGGMITEKKIKYTKNDKVMAFLQVEDLVGSVEVVVFPKVYEQYGSRLTEESKVFIKGRVDAGEDRDGKLICESIQTFEEIPKKVWLRFATLQDWENAEQPLYEAIADSDGRDSIVIYVDALRAKKVLPPSKNVRADKELLERLEGLIGQGNVKLL